MTYSVGGIREGFLNTNKLLKHVQTIQRKDIANDEIMRTKKKEENRACKHRPKPDWSSGVTEN